MKKSIFAVAAMLSIASSALAYDYPFLTVTLRDGRAVCLSADDLDMRLEAGKLNAFAQDGSFSWNVADIATMEFAKSSLSVEGIPENSVPVDVLTITGIRIGTFSSDSEALSTLGEGLYIFQSHGKSRKILKTTR